MTKRYSKKRSMSAMFNFFNYHLINMFMSLLFKFLMPRSAFSETKTNIFFNNK